MLLLSIILFKFFVGPVFSKKTVPDAQNTCSRKDRQEREGAEGIMGMTNVRNKGKIGKGN